LIKNQRKYMNLSGRRRSFWKRRNMKWRIQWKKLKRL
jgi:hypothetical protein